MAEDLSREGLARRKAAEEAAEVAKAFQGATERPELVIYANGVDVDVQADGSVVIQLTYHAGPETSTRVADVVLPAAVFANIAGKGHIIMQAAAQQLAAVTNVINAAVAKRTSLMGDTQGPPDASRDAIQRARRDAAGD